MADFISEFWNWFIIVPTLGGIAGLVWLNRWMTTSRKDDAAKTTGHVWDEDLRELNNPLPRWWLNLFYLTLAFGVVYLMLYPGLGAFQGLLGWSQTGQYQAEVASADRQFGPIYQQYVREDIRQLATNRNAVKTGERLFVNYCTTCHGSDARGAVGFPDLRDADWLWGGSPEAIKTTILDGRQGMMPGWGAVLGKDGVFKVAEYVLSLSGRHPVDATVAAAGREKFKQLCVGCHGVEGKGNQALGAPNLTDNVWLYGNSRQAIMETIEKGRQGRMPAHKEFLGEAKSHILAAYVYSLSSPANRVAASGKQ